MSKDATARSRRAPRKGLEALAGWVVAELRDVREVRALLSAFLLRADRDRGLADR